MTIADKVSGLLKDFERAKVYCDYIAHVCAVALSYPDPERIIKSVSPIRYDLDPAGGFMASTKKSLEIEDRNGRKYRVTVEEVQQ